MIGTSAGREETRPSTPQDQRPGSGWKLRCSSRTAWPRIRFAIIVVCAFGFVTRPAGHAHAAPPDHAGIRFGVAHIDVMEHHLERQPDGPPLDIPGLGDAEHDRRYTLAREMGASLHRWSIYRELVERDRVYDWRVVDRIADRDARNGFDTLAVLQGPSDGMFEPVFLGDAGPTDDPLLAGQVNPANGWARFVESSALRYRPGGLRAAEARWPAGSGVRAWEIGNEPNLQQFWAGSPADYLRYLEVAYLVIRRSDADALIMHGGIGDDGNADAWYQEFLSAVTSRAALSPLPARYNHYFDRAAWHWYRQPALLATGPERAAAMLSKMGLPPKPIWVTETGVPVWPEHPGPCWDPASPGRATLDEQAGFIWQTFAEAAASGIETIIYFQFSDDCGNGPKSYDAFGLLRNVDGAHCWAEPVGMDRQCWKPELSRSGKPRPAFDAFQVAAAQLTGASLQSQTQSSRDGSRVITFERHPSSRITVAWTDRLVDVSIALPAAAERATLFHIEADGRLVEREITPSGATYPITLPKATNRNGIAGRPIMAGRPIVLVETGVGIKAPPARDRSGLAADREPPVLAMVEALPPRSPASFDLSIIAGDRDSGLAAFVVYVASGSEPPTRTEDWRPLGGPGLWNGDPQAGRIRVRFDGEAGQTYHFAAQVGDHAGYWTKAPTHPHATTMISALSRPRPRVKPVGRGYD